MSASPQSGKIATDKSGIDQMVKLLDRIAGGDITGPELLFDQTVAWANLDAVNTIKTMNFVLPATLIRSPDARYMVSVVNPSTETALDLDFLAEIDDGGTPRFTALVDAPFSFTVPVSMTAGQSRIIQGLLVGVSGRLTLDNTTVIGAAGAFTARVQIWRV